ncbi:MAG: hypothetical protein ABI867_13405 [Kofleriaceae bacterium]
MGLGELVGAGGRAVSKYTGTLLAVFLVQTIVALAVMLGVAFVLAQAFAHLPMFDEAVEGDLVALIYCVRFGRPSILAAVGIVFSGMLVWQLASWFLSGGLYGVFAQRPEGRGDTARVFGASGATTYLAYARLWLCGLPGWVLVLFLFGTGMGIVAPRIEHALTLPQLFGPLILAALPALLAMHFFLTVAEYARIELTLRGTSHGPGVVATYFRTVVYVFKRPLTLVHSGLGWLAFFLVTAAYAYLAQGHPMYGTDGAITLFLVRQGVSLLRMAIKFGVSAGQVELARTRALPPRRVETTETET